MPAKRHCITEETKRQSNGAEDKFGHKKARVGTADSTQDALSLVISALDQALDVSDTGREMLRRVARGGLGTAADERHAYQAMAAKMLWDVLVSVEARLSLETDDSARKVDEAKSNILQRKSELCSARAALTAHTDALDAAMRRFCEHNLAMQAARQQLDVAKESRMRADTERQKLVQMQSTLEVAVRDHYTPLAKGTLDSTVQHLNKLLSALNGTSIESSLVDAFAIAAKIQPSKRGTFDRAAVTQLGHELAKRIAELSTNVPSAESTQIYVASEAAAEEAFKVAQRQQKEIAATLRAAEIEMRDADAHVCRTVDNTNEANSVLSELKTAHATAGCKLEDFRRGPFAALEAQLARHQLAVQPRTIPELPSLPTVDITNDVSCGKEAPVPPVLVQEHTASEVLDTTEGGCISNSRSQNEVIKEAQLVPGEELAETTDAVEMKRTLETLPVANTSTESMQIVPTPVRVLAT